jgi:hypothetical protein
MYIEDEKDHNGNHRNNITKSKIIEDIFICNGHKMTKCPKFTKMQKMFHGKFVAVVEVQLVADT